MATVSVFDALPPKTGLVPKHDWTDRLVVGIALVAVAGLFLLNLCELSFVDPDLWHEMALARESLELGRLPLEDRFAYTPTVYPVVHHEWGNGAILYVVATTLGAPGIMALKYTLTAAIAGLCFYIARRRGASTVTIVSLVPAIILAGCYGFTTIRAGLFTMLFLAALLAMLDRDRHGDRRWMALWLPLFVVWLNVHAGFVVALAVVATHALEQYVRQRPWLHLAALEAAMLALVAVNPYGLDYYPYLLEAVTMDRPMILEWAPLWKNDPTTFLVYLVSVLIVVYALQKAGWRRMPGLFVLSLMAYAALRHTRHLSLYFVVWLCYVPAWLEATPLATLMVRVWHRRRAWVAGFAAVVSIVSLAACLPRAPWRMRVPVTLADELTGRPMYPAGAVEYLERADFRGNMMVPFVPGGYVMWKLHPKVKVSLDGRYEVAYRPGILEENEALYRAHDGWQATLTKYATDLVLVPRSTQLAEVIGSADGWHRVYRDGAYELYARPGLDLAAVDHGDETIKASFP
ncbi:MAG TPA: hypothetical protein VHZ24_01130 [Pirellulales bacterium]|jgi:hypothetical protein|nr:hypothetical protein [Pirellulales bacterium]